MKRPTTLRVAIKLWCYLTAFASFIAWAALAVEAYDNNNMFGTPVGCLMAFGSLLLLREISE